MVVVYAMVSCAVVVSLVTGPLVAQLAPACSAPGGVVALQCSPVVVTLSRRPGDHGDYNTVISTHSVTHYYYYYPTTSSDFLSLIGLTSH